jgi:hypothetical protein
MPKEPATVVGPSVPCQLCSRLSSQLIDHHCAQCWALRQLLVGYVPLLLADPLVAPKARAMLEKALANPEPPTGAA